MWNEISWRMVVSENRGGPSLSPLALVSTVERIVRSTYLMRTTHDNGGGLRRTLKESFHGLPVSYRG